MADASTTLYLLIKPEVGASADTWGSKLNVDMDALDKLLGAINTGGSGAAYTLTSGQSLTAYASGQSFLVKASFTCNAAATLNVDGLGAKNITKRGTVATVSGDIVSGNIYRMTYDGTQFQAEGFVPGNFLLPANNLSDLASASTARTNLGLGTSATVNTGTSGATIPLLNGNNTYSGTSIFTNTVQISMATPELDLVGTSTNIPRIQLRNASRYDDVRSTTSGLEFRVNTSGTPLSMLFDTGGGLTVRTSASTETTGTLTAASANKTIQMTGDVTINNSVFSAGDVILLYAGASARSITAGTITTMRLAGSATTGTRSLAARGIATLFFVSATEVVVAGTGVT